jgi:hypothetical protein
MPCKSYFGTDDTYRTWNDVDHLHNKAAILGERFDDWFQLSERPDAPNPTRDYHLQRLASARFLRDFALAAELEIVREARAAGLSWVDVGERYGISRQAAQQRFGVVDK